MKKIERNLMPCNNRRLKTLRNLQTFHCPFSFAAIKGQILCVAVNLSVQSPTAQITARTREKNTKTWAIVFGSKSKKSWIKSWFFIFISKPVYFQSQPEKISKDLGRNYRSHSAKLIFSTGLTCSKSQNVKCSFSHPPKRGYLFFLFLSIVPLPFSYFNH